MKESRKEMAMAFRDIANEVEKYTDGLNQEEVLCTCCGLMKWKNWEEKQLADSITAVAAKLRKLALSMERIS